MISDWIVRCIHDFNTWRVFLPGNRTLSPACICQTILWPGALIPGRGGPPCWPCPRHPPWPPSSRAQSSSRHWSDSPASESGRDDTWHAPLDTWPGQRLLNKKYSDSDIYVFFEKNFVYQSLPSCLSVPESSVHCATVKHLLRTGDWHRAKSGLKFCPDPGDWRRSGSRLDVSDPPPVTRTVQERIPLLGSIIATCAAFLWDAHKTPLQSTIMRYWQKDNHVMHATWFLSLVCNDELL